MIKNLFVPNEHNKYVPILINRGFLFIYLAILISFNFITPPSNYRIQSESTISTQEIVLGHNRERSKNGLSQLSLNNQLTNSAIRKAESMLDSNCWSHYCPDGKSPWEFFDSAGYSYAFAGENLAEGFSSVEEVMNAWMNSPTHRDNVLNKNFDEIGIGFAYGKFQNNESNTIIVVHFGRQLNNNTIFSNSPINTNLQNSISIDTPQDLAYTNVSEVSVSGTIYPANQVVELQVGGLRTGRVNAEGENYTVRTNLEDGKYNLQTLLLDLSSNLLASSEIIQLNVDTVVPEMYIQTLVAQQSSSYYYLEFQTTDDVNQILLIDSIGNVKRVGAEYWAIELEKNSVGRDSISIQLVDNAANVNNVKIPLQIVIDRASESGEYTKSASVFGGIDVIFSSFVNYIFDVSNPRVFVPFLFSIYLSILFIIDFISLKNSTVVSHNVYRKSHLTAGIFIVILLMINFGNLTGQVLVGINS